MSSLKDNQAQINFTSGTSDQKSEALEKFNAFISRQESYIADQIDKFKSDATENSSLQIQFRRENDLLRPVSGECPGWAFNVPRCFNGALDILYMSTKLKTGVLRGWTQGASFAFAAYDILYDANLDGVTLWSDCLKKFSRCIRVKTSASAGPMGEGVKGSRYAGKVDFDVLVPDSKRLRLIKKNEYSTTQDNFIRYLISGEEGYL